MDIKVSGLLQKQSDSEKKGPLPFSCFFEDC
jgi:hypothetical protein